MKAFMIGVSTAAHQVEGDNKNSDFWQIENITIAIEKILI